MGFHNSRSSDWVTGGEQEKFYATVFGIYLFYDLFLLGRGEGGICPPPGILHWLI